MILTEKYRPKSFDKVVGLPLEIPSLLNNLPNMLFIGKPGTGKTTTAKIIIKELQSDCLILNASSERGIDIVRNKIQGFAMTQSNNNKIKIIFLDEMDATTNDFQTALRNLMETYHSNVRFICTANYENKIIEPLKSRLKTFIFKADEDNNFINYLNDICIKENIKVDKNILLKIIKINSNDVRKCVNQLQTWCSLNREIIESDVHQSLNLSPEIHNLLLKSDFITARQTLLDSNIEYDVFLDEYHDYLVDLFINKKSLSAKQFASIVNSLANAIIHINSVISKEIIVENFLIKTIQGLKE